MANGARGHADECAALQPRSRTRRAQAAGPSPGARGKRPNLFLPRPFDQATPKGRRGVVGRSVAAVDGRRRAIRPADSVREAQNRCLPFRIVHHQGPIACRRSRERRFLRCLAPSGSFEARSTFSTWLLAITRHKAITSSRRHAQERSHEELTETIEDPAEDPEAALQRKQRILLLSDCLRQLPAGCRAVIDLVYYHHKTIKEVADILQIPVNTVKSRMFWARRRIGEIGRRPRTPGLENSPNDL